MFDINLPFSGEKPVKPISASTTGCINRQLAREWSLPLRVIAVCRCSAVLWILCRVCFTNISGSTLRIMPISVVYFAAVRLLFCAGIADRYHAPGTRYQVFDTAHTRSISGYTLRLRPIIVNIEYLM